MSDRGRDAEVLALRHQIMVLERQLGGDRVQFAPADRGVAGRSAAPASTNGAAPAAATGMPGHRAIGNPRRLVNAYSTTGTNPKIEGHHLPRSERYVT